MEFVRSFLAHWFFQTKPVETGVPQSGVSDFLNLCNGTIAKLDELIKPFKQRRESSKESDYQLMNQYQCLLLVRRLSDTHKSTLAEIQQSSLDGKRTQVLRELHHVLLDADKLIQSCCIKSTALASEWLRAAIEQGDMKETFSKLLYDVEWHSDVLQSIDASDFEDSASTFAEAKWRTGDQSVKIERALLEAKKKDDNFLIRRLESLKLDDRLEQELADRLVAKMKPAEGHQVSPDSVGHLLLLDPEKLEQHLDGGKQLGKGSFGRVQETDVLGGSFAVKILLEEPTVKEKDSIFEKEIDAIQGLGHHPHIVRLYCYSRNGERCYLLMEKMDKDLDQFLEHRRHSRIKLSLLEKIVLMLDIAEGVRHIHSKHMAHRDLKPGNVLVNLEDPSNESLRACSVKIADFGLTKTKNASRTYKDQTTNTGTARYMAPEVIAFPSQGHPIIRTELNPRKADAYSFGIMCFEILTGEIAFGDRLGIFVKKQVKDSAEFRPNLQNGTGSLRLESLIQRCWDGNFRSRPDFDRICHELRYIKGLLLRGDQQMLQTNIDFTNELGSNYKITEHQDVPQEPGIVSNLEGEQVSPKVTAPTKALPVKQGPWGRNERNKTTGLFDHMAASIKWIRLKYQQNPPGIGCLEVGYVESGGQERIEKYCDNVIGTTKTEIKFNLPDEYIKQVSGCVATHSVSLEYGGRAHFYCVVSLTIRTNLKSYGPFGDETIESGKRFKSGTGRVVGFFGAGGALLDKLGVWIIPDGQEDGDPSYLIDQ